MKRILLLGTAREDSTRLKSKMTRPFGDTTLFEIYLKKLLVLKKINDSLEIFADIGMALNPEDTILWKTAKEFEVPIIERNRRSVIGSQNRTRAEELHFLADRDEEYVLWLNGCLPFLRPETVVDAVRFFHNHDYPSLTCVTRQKNWFWTLDGQAINNLDPTCTGTQFSPPILVSNHAFHIFLRKNLLERGTHWNLGKNDPFLYELDHNIELLDIDTELEFHMAASLRSAGYAGTRYDGKQDRITPQKTF